MKVAHDEPLQCSKRDFTSFCRDGIPEEFEEEMGEMAEMRWGGICVLIEEEISRDGAGFIPSLELDNGNRGVFERSDVESR